MRRGRKEKVGINSSRDRQPMFIFEIPIYRVSRDQFEKETDPNGSGKAISEKMSRNEHLDSNEQFWLHYLEQWESGDTIKWSAASVYKSKGIRPEPGSSEEEGRDSAATCGGCLNKRIR